MDKNTVAAPIYDRTLEDFGNIVELGAEGLRQGRKVVQ
jgi:hypothetical protein